MPTIPKWDQLKGKMIAVTGGCGFIGSHLVKMLASSEAAIEVVDNLQHASIEPHQLPCGFTRSDVKDWLPRHKYDYFFHLASVVGPAGVLQSVGSIGNEILAGGLRMARLAMYHNAVLVVASSSEVYGPGDIDPNIGQREDDPKIVPSKYTVRLEYGVGKLAEEIALVNLCRTKGLKVRIARFFNVIGPDQDRDGLGGFVVPRFFKQAMRNEPLTVFGDGNQLRCLTDVDDICIGLIRLALDGGNGQIYNLGNPKNKVTISELARKIHCLAGSASQILKVDPTILYGPTYAEAWNKIPNCDKIKEDIGWEAKIDLETALKRVHESLKPQDKKP